MKFKFLFLILFIPLISLATKKDFGYTENKGQIHDQNGNARPDVLFMHEANGLKVILRENGFSYELVRTEVEEKEPSDDPMMEAFQEVPNITQYIHRIDIEWPGANANIELSRKGPSPDYLNFYQGQLKAEMVRGFQQVTYHEVWPGVDIVFKMEDGRPKYDIVLQSGADLSQVQFKYLGADGLELKNDALLIQTGQGVLTEDVPASFDISGRSLEIKMALDADVLLFNGSTENGLIIDPVPYRLWATYYGAGSSDKFLNAVNHDVSSIALIGFTNSTGLATSGAYQVNYASVWDGLIGQFDQNGQREWMTYFGSDSLDQGFSIQSKSNGNLVCSFATMSPDLPVTSGAHKEICSCQYETMDGYIAEFSPDGFWLGGTFFGGDENEHLDLVLIDDDTYGIYGFSKSPTDIATSGSFDESLSGTIDGFIGVINDQWELQWCTYLGSSGIDGINETVYRNGILSAVGDARGTFPTTPDAIQNNFSGDVDGFFTQFDLFGNLIYSTLYGGSSDNGSEYFNAIDLGPNDSFIIGGPFESPNKSTSGAAFEVLDGTLLGILLKIDSTGDLEWATYTPQSTNSLTIQGSAILCGGEYNQSNTQHIRLERYNLFMEDHQGML